MFDSHNLPYENTISKEQFKRWLKNDIEATKFVDAFHCGYSLPDVEAILAKKEQRQAASSAERDLQKIKSESELLKQQIRNANAAQIQEKRVEANEKMKATLTEWKKEAEMLAKERDVALEEVKRLQARAQEFRKERDDFKAEGKRATAEAEAAAAKAAAQKEARKEAERAARASRNSRQEQEQQAGAASPRDSAPEGLDTMLKEIDDKMKELRKVPQADRASELRTMKRSYHPDAQRLKTAAVQQLFTQLSQHVNSYCEPHLRQNCRDCANQVSAI